MCANEKEMRYEMDLNFRPVEAEDMSRLRPFYGLRPNRTCDSVFLDSFYGKITTR